MLTAHEFARGLARLGVVFHRKVSDEMVDAYYDELKTMQGVTWDRVVREAVRSLQKFPNVHDLRKLAFQNRTPARPQAATPTGPTPDPVHAKESFALIRAIQRGEIAGRDIYLCFQAMDARFPDFGWDEAVKDWEARHPEDVEP